MNSSTDRIEKEILLQAPRSRVWRALSNADEFGTWFGVKLKGQVFAPGERVRGELTACGHENVVLELQIETVQPEERISMRWHPFAIDPAVDYSGEPTTLIEFELTEETAGTRLRVIESGFDALPDLRRREAFPMNTRGWEGQLKNIAKHVAAS